MSKHTEMMTEQLLSDVPHRVSSRFAALLMALACALVVGWTTTAWGQQGDEPVAPESESEAADAAAEAQTEDEAAPAEATEAPLDPATQEAIERFMQGLELAQAGNCRGALAELQASLDLVERPNTHFNMARCQEELFRYDLAVQHYERYVEIAPPDAEDLAAVEASMRQLRNLLGSIEVESNVPAEVWVGDRQAGVAPGTVLIPGGRHAVEVRAEGYISVRREVEVASRRTASLVVELRSSEVINNNQTFVTETGGTSVGLFATAAALTGASLATALGFSIRAKSLSNEANDLPRYDYPAANEANDRIRSRALIADVMWGVTGAFAVVTTVLIFTTNWDEGEAESGEQPGEQADGVQVSVAPVFSTQGAGLTMEGQF